MTGLSVQLLQQRHAARLFEIAELQGVEIHAAGGALAALVAAVPFDFMVEGIVS